MNLAVLTIFILSLAAGCATVDAPPGYLPEPEEATSETFGAWIEVRPSGTVGSVLRGELIAVDADSLLLFARDRGTGEGVTAFLTALHRPDVRSASVFRYDTNSETIALWTLGGILSTASHGVALVISAPLWLLVGSGAAAVHSRTARVKYPEDVSWRDLASYGRFPAGLPPKIRRAELRPKPELLQAKER